MRCLVLAALLAACSGSTPAPPSNKAPPPDPAPKKEPPPALDVKILGQPCKPDGTCPAPTECVKFYGVAGMRGPQYALCEIPCVDKPVCPEGTTCRTIADGPGPVCRP